MCLIAWRWSPTAATPLLWAANRDEFAHRHTAPLQPWKAGDITIYSGLDLALEPQNNLLGTWSGMSSTGRFAWLTNIRSPMDKNPQALSRGHIVSQYLARETWRPADYLSALRSKAHRYNGFNLVLGRIHEKPELSECWHYNSRSHIATHLAAGVYGLSNATLDSPWPKTRALVQAVALAAASEPLNRNTLFSALGERVTYPTAELPATGLPIELEQVLSAAFIASNLRGADYGTRSSTVGWCSALGANLEERSFDANGDTASQVAFNFAWEKVSEKLPT